MHDPAPLIPDALRVAPWNGNGNCVRTIEAERVPAGAYIQTIDAPAAGDYRFGVSLFAPVLAAGETVPVRVAVIQRNGRGVEIASNEIVASVADRYRSFDARLRILEEAAAVTFAISPSRSGVEIAVTGALISR